MSEKKLNRGWVKNAAIIFLAVMLLLTFFSNTIMNRSLPEVAVKYTESGTITAKIRGTGTVEANKTYEVNLEQTRTVASVAVRVGDTVAEGDLLCSLEDKESDELKSAREALDELTLSYQKALLDNDAPDYAKEQRAIVLAEEDLREAKRKLVEEVTPAEIEKAKDDVQDAKDLVKECSADVEKYKSELAAVSASSSDDLLALRRSIEDKQYAIDNYDETETETPLAELMIQLSRLQEDYQRMLDKNDDYKYWSNKLDDAEDDLYDAEQEQADAEEKLKDLQDQDGDYETREQAVRTAQKALDDLVFDLAEQKKADAKASATAKLDLAAMQKKLAAQKKEVARLEADSTDAAITAPMAGIVKTINVTAGTNNTPGTPLVVLEAPDLGYVISFSVTAEQAKRVKVGDAAEVSNYYWGPSIQATLSQIKTDPENPGVNKLLVFTLSGEVETGSQLSLSIGEKSANYDLIVPKSAIRSDSAGSFVLIVEAKSTPLGNRYIARRVDVQVLAEDDTNTAISGGVNNYDYVITTSSLPLESGMQVRMAE